VCDQDSDNFALERYKYIQQQMGALNQNIYRYLTLFQTLATAIVGAIVAIFASWQSANVSAEVAKVGIRSLLGLLTVLALFVVFSVSVGIASWFDYRKEEVELLGKVGRSDLRAAPRLKNLWRWYETCIIFFIIAVVVLRASANRLATFCTSQFSGRFNRLPLVP
jgi:hypothetical protein